MKYILIVEDSKVTARALKDLVSKNIKDLIPIVKTTEADATEFIKKYHKDIFVALLDLNLPDTVSQGHIVDVALAKQIKSIVLTGNTSDKIRKKFLVRLDVVDYVVKDSLKNIEYVVGLLNWIYQNSKSSSKTLLVEDSKVQRHMIKSTLSNLYMNVLEAEDGETAYKLIQDNDDINLVIVDLNIPKMDGVELTLKVRQNIKRDIVIIGITAESNGMKVAKFLKYGANDYLKKPFLNEEFINRIHKDMLFLNQTVELKEQIAEVEKQKSIAQELASTDYLTKIPNRLKFNKIMKFQCQKDKPLALFLFDLDDFKKINDVYGHHIGDKTLINLSSFISDKLKESYNEDSYIFARWGGEEFIILFINQEFKNVKLFSTRLTLDIAKHTFDEIDKLTISAGLIELDKEKTINQNFVKVDKLLLKAKNNGKNRVLYN